MNALTVVPNTALSVVIVSWNCRSHLEDCLTALAGLPAEVIVIDNHSMDGTPAMLRERFPAVRLIEMERNMGFAAAANRGIQSARPGHIWLLNPDVVAEPAAARTLLKCLDLYPRAGAVGPRLLRPDGSTDPRSARRYPTLWSEWAEKLGLRALAERLTRLPLDWQETSSVPLISGAGMLLHRSALEEVGLFDESFFLYAEDMDLCRRLQSAGWQVVYCGAAQIIHYGGASSSRAPAKAGIQAILSMARYLDKHHGRSTGAIYRVSMFVLSLGKWVLFSLLSIIAPAGKMRDKRNLHRRLMAALWRGDTR